MSRIALRATGLRKEFGDDGVIEGIDLSVRENEVLVLLGPNGVGKSVLLSCLAGSRRPSAGEVEVFDRPVAEDGGEGYGFLCQETMAVETLTGRENAEFYSRLHPAFSDRWERYVETLSLADDLDERVAHYSGGMLRKLELALTLSLDVPLYLLDEPTAGVDVSVIQRFHDVVLERVEAGATVVLSSHRPMDVDLADRLAFVSDGTVSTVDAPAALQESMPPVVRLSETDAIPTAEDFVEGGRVFPVGGEARGFLEHEAELSALRDVLGGRRDGADVAVVDPTPADLFNYYVHVRPAAGGGDGS